MSDERVVIVGAGVGGLAAAIELAVAGLDVTLIERADVPGGKIRELSHAGVRIDSGPTVLTMKWVFDELFATAGANLDERLELTRAEVLCRHAWSEHERLDLFADPQRTADAIGSFAGPHELRGFLAFRRRAAEIYQTLEHSFIRAPRPTPVELVRRAGLSALLKIKPYATLWSALGEFFSNPHLRQLFGRYATYCGSSPFFAPATLMLVAHVELEGVWRVVGGMQRLAAALARLAAELGVRFRLQQTVSELLLERGRISGVKLATGERVPATSIVLNADAAALAAGLFGRSTKGAISEVPFAARSLSALTFSLHTATSGFPLSRHNVFFSADYSAEFHELFKLHALPREPTVYICAQDREDDDAAARSEGAPERLFGIINAPATGDRELFEKADIERCVQGGLKVLHRCGLHLLTTPMNGQVSSPRDFELRFPQTGGALYGRATHGAAASFQRPGSRTRIPGLYLAGGSVHPGPGVPMAALSGRLAAHSLIEDLPSIVRSHRVAMPGGT